MFRCFGLVVWGGCCVLGVGILVVGTVLIWFVFSVIFLVSVYLGLFCVQLDCCVVKIE